MSLPRNKDDDRISQLGKCERISKNFEPWTDKNSTPLINFLKDV